MTLFKRISLYLLSIPIVLFSNVCIAGRYDVNHGSSGLILWINLITLGIALYFANKRINEAIEYDEPVYELYNDWVFLSWFLVIITVVLAWFNLPSEYFFYINRPILFIAAVIAIFKTLSSEEVNKISLWLMVFFAFIHNPIFPVMLGSGTKPIWVVLNLIFVVSLIVIWDPPDDEDNLEGTEGIHDKNNPDMKEGAEQNEIENIDIPELDDADKDDYDINVIDEHHNDPDVSLIIHRNQVTLIKSNIHLIIPLLEDIDKNTNVPVDNIIDLFGYINGKVHWHDVNNIDKGCIVTINDVDRTFDDYASLKGWINNVLTKRLIDYVSY